MLLNPMNRRVRENQGIPIMPGAFPGVGHLPAIVLDLPNLLRHAERELGTHFWLNFGPGGQAMTCVHPDVFSLFKNKVTTSQLIEEMVPELMTGALVANDGAFHRQLRAAMNGAFVPKGLTAAGIGSLFGSIIEQRVQRWRRQRTIRVLPETRDLMLTLVFRLMGVDAADLDRWRSKYGALLQLIVAPPVSWPGTPLWRGRRARKWIDEQLRGFIREARAKVDPQGLLGVLAKSFDESDDPLADTHLIANLRLLILAGHDTTASTMAWILIELAQRPEVWDALCDEAQRVGDVPKGPGDLPDCRVAEALFRETLRCHPATTLTPRRAVVDFELAGRTVPAGTHMCIPIIHLSKLRDLFDRADEFMLERWLARDQPIKPLDMLQFGAGPHVCIGYHLVWMELVQFSIALALTMHKDGLRPLVLNRTAQGARYYPTAHPPVSVRVGFL